MWVWWGRRGKVFVAARRFECTLIDVAVLNTADNDVGVLNTLAAIVTWSNTNTLVVCGSSIVLVRAVVPVLQHVHTLINVVVVVVLRGTRVRVCPLVVSWRRECHVV